MSRLGRALRVLRRDGPGGVAREAAEHLRWRATVSEPGVRFRGCRYARRGDGVDPLRVSYVDPDRIQRVTGGITETDPGGYHLQRVEGFDPSVVGLGAVRGGDWDRSETRFESLAEYEALRSVLRDGEAWRDTELYARHRSRIESGAVSFGCRTVADLEERTAAIDDLRERVEREGYRSRGEVGADPLDEIRVTLGRDGDVLYNDEGRHRLAIAKLLGVDRVPVYVVARHEELVYP